MKTELRKYISHWAFLPLDQFTDDESLSAKRKNFGYCSKMGMLVDATYPKYYFLMLEEDVDRLDTVNDFVEYLKAHGVTKINDFEKIPETA